MEVLFLCHNSGSFHGKVNPFSVVDQMKIHGILCAERVVGCDGVCNLTMGFDCFLMQCISCAFYKRGIELLITGISLGTTTFLLLRAIAA